MKILVNREIRGLFVRILLCLLASLLFSAVTAVMAVGGKMETDVVLVLLPAGQIAAGIAVLLACCRYFLGQNRRLEEAAAQVRDYIAGDREVRIACNEEGELYRLFHEVNSLAAILSARAEQRGRAGAFLKQTISDISHQLKTPLAALSIYNGIMQAEAGEQGLPVIQKFSDLSEQELDRIESLVQNLLKIASFDAGTIVIERQPENLAQMMAEVKRYFAFRAGQEGKEIALEGSEDILFSCDRSWMIEAVSNLVKNALDHMKRGDLVQICWRQSASMVQIRVSDNGSGIHPEDLHHIFKRFYRSRYSKDTQGIGLGLPLAKLVVEAHRGTIEVDSRPGAGSAFVMNFLTAGHG